MLEKLSRSFRFAIFTGRPQREAELTLRRFAPQLVFDPIVGMDDVRATSRRPMACCISSGTRRHKPVLHRRHGGRRARARAPPACRSSASRRPRIPLYLDLVFLFQEEGAYAIVDDINYLEEVFAA